VGGRSDISAQAPTDVAMPCLALPLPCQANLTARESDAEMQNLWGLHRRLIWPICLMAVGISTTPGSYKPRQETAVFMLL
jgi:hypothetical protein